MANVKNTVQERDSEDNCWRKANTVMLLFDGGLVFITTEEIINDWSSYMITAFESCKYVNILIFFG